MEQIGILFLVAFLLNVLWENLHSFLYKEYKGATITEFVLVRASLFDAFLITLVATPFLFNNYLNERIWLLAFILLCIAIVNEWYGLSTKRWRYNSKMPVIPFVKVGVTPTVQLSILGLHSYIFATAF